MTPYHDLNITSCIIVYTNSVHYGQKRFQCGCVSLNQCKMIASSLGANSTMLTPLALLWGEGTVTDATPAKSCQTTSPYRPSQGRSQRHNTHPVGVEKDS